MPTTDIEERVVEAFTAIVAADAGLQALFGRSSQIVYPWDDSNWSAILPVLVYAVIVHQESGGVGDNRLLTIQATVFAQGNNARALCSAAMERLEIAVTEPAFVAQNLDAAPMPGRRRRYRAPIPPEESRDLRRADMDLTIWVTK